MNDTFGLGMHITQAGWLFFVSFAEFRIRLDWDGRGVDLKWTRLDGDRMRRENVVEWMTMMVLLNG